MSDTSDRSLSRWRWLWRILFGLLALLALSVATAWIWWRNTHSEGQKELEAAVAETDAIDPRWRWEQIEEDRPAVPDEENSVFILKRFDASRRGWDPGAIKMPNQEKLLPEEFDNHLLTDARLSLLRQELKNHQSSVDLAWALRNYPHGRARLEMPTNVIKTLLPHCDHSRMAMHVLVLESERLLHEGDAAGAFARIIPILNAGAVHRGEGMSISQLVRISLRANASRRVERVLGVGKVAAEDLKSMQKRMELEESEELLILAMRGERAIWTMVFDTLASGKIHLSEIGSQGRKQQELGERLSWEIYKARLPADQAYYYRKMQDVIAIVRLPLDRQIEAIGQFRKDLVREVELAQEKKERMLAPLVLPAVDKFILSAIRDKALLRCVITALAAERYRIAAGHWPKRLEDLCPAQMNAVLLDPYDGKPLKFVARNNGVTIYTVGVDGEDDGGLALSRDGSESGKDLGIQLWNPDRRGLPAGKKDDED